MTGTINTAGNRLIIVGAGDISSSSAISGAGDLLRQDGGTLTLTGNNSFGTATNAVFLDKGTIQVGTGGTVGTTNGISTGWINMSASVPGRNGDTNLLIRDSGVTIANPIDSRYFATDVPGNQMVGGASTFTSGTGTFSGSIALHDNIALTASGTSNIIFSGQIQPGSLAGLNNQTSGQTLIGGIGGGVTKVGTGTVTLTVANTYAGGTTVSFGTLLANNTSGSATGSFTVAVSSGAILGGSGIISGATTSTGATLAPGSAAATAGTLTFGAGLALNSSSIFEWDMQATTTDPGAAPAAGGTNPGAYDQVVLNGAANSLSGSGAIFKVVLGTDKSFVDAFWDTNKTWTNVFTGSGVATSLASIFSTFNANGSNLTAGLVPGQGTFTFNGSSTVNWTAVPEPSSALAGLLLATGLLRRRRA